MIAWLNANNGFVMVLLTLAYVLCTGAIVIFMIQANNIAQKNLRQLLELEKRRSRPYVIFDIECRSNQLLYAVLRNVGLTAAYHINVNCEPALINTFREKPSVLSTGETLFLAPQRTLEDIIENVGHRGYIATPVLIHGSVDYQDADGTKYKDPISIDRSRETERLNFERDSLGQEIRGVKSALEKISNQLNPSRR